MTVPAHKPSLIAAVKDLVSTDFLLTRQRFSAHDVTAKLRAKVLEQVQLLGPITQFGYVPLVDPRETGFVRVQGQDVPRVEHEDVKNIVHEFFTLGGMPGYGRLNNGNFWEYDTTENLSNLGALAV